MQFLNSSVYKSIKSITMFSLSLQYIHFFYIHKHIFQSISKYGQKCDCSVTLYINSHFCILVPETSIVNILLYVFKFLQTDGQVENDLLQ